MKTTNHRCDFCRKLTTEEGVKKEALHGYTYQLGYSIGGWGSRRDFIPPQSAEICSQCFAKVKEKSEALACTINGLKGNYTIVSDL